MFIWEDVLLNPPWFQSASGNLDNDGNDTSCGQWVVGMPNNTQNSRGNPAMASDGHDFVCRVTGSAAYSDRKHVAYIQISSLPSKSPKILSSAPLIRLLNRVLDSETVVLHSGSYRQVESQGNKVSLVLGQEWS